MVDLRDYARRKRGKEETDVLTARLPKRKIRDFKELCKELGLSVSEAIHLMIDDQLAVGNERKNKESIQSKTISNTNEDKSNTKSNTNDVENNTFSITNGDKKVKTVEKRVYSRKSSSGEKRFTTNPWKIGKEIACPLCKEWTSWKNYARHCDEEHDGLRSKEIFSDEENAKIADEMVRQRKEEEGSS